MQEIRTESAFLWSMIKHLLLTPVRLILFLFGKRTFADITQPLKDTSNFFFEARLTATLIIINILCFIAQIFIPQTNLVFLLNYSTNLFNPLLWYTFITSGFLHANLAHLFGNMLFLFIFGRIVEKSIGKLRMFGIYFMSLIIGNIFEAAFTISNPVYGLGASGAIMGLVSAAVCLMPLTFVYEFIIPLPLMIVGWLAIWSDISGILNPTADGIGHFAHIGGFLSVSLSLFLLTDSDKKVIWKGFLINIASLAGLGILAVLFLKI